MIALDTALDPPSTADITYATDNEQAGKLIGQYAAAKLDGKPAVDRDARPVQQPGRLGRHRPRPRLPRGHGHQPRQHDPERPGGQDRHVHRRQGGTYKIACHQPTQGAIDGGRTAMEKCLSANPDINVVYTINEPAGRGRLRALKAGGQAGKRLVFAIDGSCQGIEAASRAASSPRTRRSTPARWRSSASTRSPRSPTAAASRPLTAGKDFFDTGTALVDRQARRRRHEPDPRRRPPGLLGS